MLREDAICNADDLPRYTGLLNAEAEHKVGSSGTGEIRMCRDWNKLREFAIEHSACYRWEPEERIGLLERYKRCPDGGRPWEEREGR